jgi:MFS family permease
VWEFQVVRNPNQSIHSTQAFRLATLLRSVAEGLITISVPFQAIHLGAGPQQLGILGSLLSGSYTVGCLVFARLIGRLPMRGSVLLVLAALSVIGLAIGLAPNLVLLCVVLVVCGLVTSLFWPQVMTWLAENAGTKGMTHEFGGFNLSWCAGMPVGMLIGGWLFEKNTYLPYFVSFVVTWVAIAIFWRFTSPRNSHLISTTDASVTPEQLESSSRARTFLLMSWIGNFATYYLAGNIRYQLPKLVKSVGMGEGAFGSLVFLINAAQLATFLVLMRTERWHFKRTFLWWAQVLVVLASLIVYSSVKPGALAVAFLCAGVGLGITYFSSQYYGIRYPLGRGRRAAIHESLIGGGYLAGALCGGLIAHAYSLRAPYLASAFVILALLAAQILFDKYRHPVVTRPKGQPVAR